MIEILGWLIWGLNGVFAALLLRVVFDSGRPDRQRESVLLIAVLFGLIVTLCFDVSKFHLLWFIPLVVSGTTMTPNSHWPDMDDYLDPMPPGQMKNERQRT